MSLRNIQVPRNSAFRPLDFRVNTALRLFPVDSGARVRSVQRISHVPRAPSHKGPPIFTLRAHSGKLSLLANGGDGETKNAENEESAGAALEKITIQTLTHIGIFALKEKTSRFHHI